MAKGAAKAQKTKDLAPRERILAAAADLFYRQGLRAVGVDAIAEAAGTNKMTLYRHFESKDTLVAEYLRRAASEAEAHCAVFEARHPADPRAQLVGWLTEMADAVASTDDRGCPLANAAVELPDKRPSTAPSERAKAENCLRFSCVICCLICEADAIQFLPQYTSASIMYTVRNREQGA